jgi:hypothetical protein
MLGQVATAEAAVLLTRERARMAENSPEAAWPELAEWNCFACHHDLQSTSWRQHNAPSAETISRPTRNAWPFALLEVIPERVGQPAAGAATKRLSELQRKLSRPATSPRDVAAEAQQVATLLTAWADALNRPKTRALFPWPAAHSMMRQLSGEFGRQRAAENWDSATQVYLALSALQDVTIGPRVGADRTRLQRLTESDASLKRMAEILNFPIGFSSPRTFDSETITRLQAELRRMESVLDEIDKRKR